MRRLIYSASILFATILLSTFVSSCSSDSEETDSNNKKQLAEVNVTLSALDIQIIPDILRASNKTATEAGINRISFAIFDSGADTLVYTTTQSSGELGFGQISTKLPIGNYTFVAVAQNVIKNDAPAASIISPTEVTLCKEGVGYVYSATKSVSINTYATQNVTIDMGRRINAQLIVKVTDPTPENVESIQIIMSPSLERPEIYSINPSAGLATDNWRYERTFSKTDLGIQTFTNLSFGCSMFLNHDDGQPVDILINMLDAEGNVLYPTYSPGINIERAQVLSATGPLFSLSTQGSLIFDPSTELIHITLQ